MEALYKAFKAKYDGKSVSQIAKETNLGRTQIEALQGGTYKGNVAGYKKIKKALGLNDEEFAKLVPDAADKPTKPKSGRKPGKKAGAKRGRKPGKQVPSKEKAVAKIIKAIEAFKSSFAVEDLKTVIAEIKAKKQADLDARKAELDAKKEEEQKKFEAEVSTLAAVEAIAQ